MARGGPSAEPPRAIRRQPRAKLFSGEVQGRKVTIFIVKTPPILHRNRGFALLSVLMTSVIGAIIFVGFQAMVGVNRRTERGVASEADLTKIGIALERTFATPESCAKSGLIGVTVNPVASPSPVPVAVSLPGLASPYLGESTRAVKAIYFSRFEPVGTEYFATLKVETEITGPGITSRNPNKLFYLNLALDGANRIIKCYASASASSNSFSGQTTVIFFNNDDESEITHVNFPAVCNNPIVVTQSLTDSVYCSDGNSRVGVCPNKPTSSSQDVHSSIRNVTTTGFDVWLSSDSGVCVGTVPNANVGDPCGSVSPQYKINYHVDCDNVIPTGAAPPAAVPPSRVVLTAHCTTNLNSCTCVPTAGTPSSAIGSKAYDNNAGALGENCRIVVTCANGSIVRAANSYASGEDEAVSEFLDTSNNSVSCLGQGFQLGDPLSFYCQATCETP